MPPLGNATGAKALPVGTLEEHRRNPARRLPHHDGPDRFALENFDNGSVAMNDGGTAWSLWLRVYGTADGRRACGSRWWHACRVHPQHGTVSRTPRAVERVLRYARDPRHRREAARSGNRFLALILAIVKSTPFQMRRVEEEEK